MKYFKDAHGVTLTITQEIKWHLDFVLQGYLKVF